EASHQVTIGAGDASICVSMLCADKATKRESGDQNGKEAQSARAKGWAQTDARGRCASMDLPVASSDGNAEHHRAAASESGHAAGSLGRHFMAMRSGAGGVSGWLAEIGGGSRSSMPPSTLAWLFPSTAFRPVNISYATTPNAKMSVRESASCPSICSGAMY